MKKLFGKSNTQRTPQYAPPPGAPPTTNAPGAMQGRSQQQYAPPPGPPPPLQNARPAAPVVPGREDQFAALKRYDLAILVDDSESMEMFWDQTRDALVGVAEVAVRYDPDGIDMYFMNSTYVARNVRTAQDVASVFRRVEPRKSTPTATALARILDPYIDSLERAKAAGQRPGPRPLNLVCLTDGAPNRGEEPEEIIVSVAKRLDAGRFPPYQLGLQFILVADDDVRGRREFMMIGARQGAQEAATALQSLDDDLKSKYTIRDIVDFTPFPGKIDSDFLLKALLGGINRKIDANQGL